jgi:hypothetical protein
MAIFRQRFVIEAPFPVDVAWKKLLAVVKTDPPTCAQCGQILAGAGARFCSNCGRQAPSQPWQRPASFSQRGFEFEGYVSPQGFRISRIITYSTSRTAAFISIVTGRFEPSGAGTRIVIEMKMHPLGWLFLVAGTGLSFFVPAAYIAGGYPSSVVLAIVALAAPCVIGMMCWFFFAAEAGTARAAIGRIWGSAPPSATR